MTTPKQKYMPKKESLAEQSAPSTAAAPTPKKHTLKKESPAEQPDQAAAAAPAQTEKHKTKRRAGPSGSLTLLPKTIEELDLIRDECKSMVTKRAGLSAGAAVVPIPGIDIGADVGLLMEMIPAINERFGLTPGQIDQLPLQVKKITVVAITSVGSEFAGKMITKHLIVNVLKKIGIRVTSKAFVKFIPFLGQAVAASISFGAMRMVGNAHVDDCYAVAKQAIEGSQGRPT